MNAPRATRTPGDKTAAPKSDAIPASAPAADDSALPNSVDIDARALRGPVLTRQGWVCPDEVWQKDNKEAFQRLQRGEQA